MPKRKIQITAENGDFVKEINAKVSKRGIDITNSVDTPIYVACYFSLVVATSLFKEHFLFRLSEPVEIAPNTTAEIQRTSHRCFSTRKPLVIFTRERILLSDKMPRFSANQLGHRYIFLSTKENIVLHRGLLSTESQVGKENTLFDGVITDQPVVVRTCPLSFSTTTAQIVYRRGHFISNPMPIGDKEKETFTARNKLIRKSLENFLGEEIPDNIKVPNISVCFSGGSYRAMLATLGFLKGLQDISFFDCTSYLAGLSGSCWALGLWYSTFQKGYDAMIKELERKLSRGIRETYSNEAKAFVKQLNKERMELELPRTKMVDLYQALVANQLFDDLFPSGYEYDFSHLHEYCNFEEGKLPLPILTAVFKEPHNFEWLEITPFEVGSQYLGGYIPTEKFGCYFQQGRIVHEAPNLRLSRIMSFACSVQCFTIYRLLCEVAGPDLSTDIGSESLANVAQLELSENEMSIYNKNFLEESQNTLTSSSSQYDSQSYGSENIITNSNQSVDSELNSNSDVNVSESGKINRHERKERKELEKRKAKEEKIRKKEQKLLEKQKKKEQKKNEPSSIAVLAKKTAGMVDFSQRLSDKYLFRPGTFPNFTFGLDGSPTKHKKFLKLVDGGFDFCFPFPPLLLQQERIPDVLIIIEMSSTPLCETGQTLQDALKWVRARDLPFPKIDFEKTRIPFPDNLPYVIFKDEERDYVPIVIYTALQKIPSFSEEFDPIQNMKDGGFCGTFNYKFTADQIHQITGVMAELAKSLESALKEVVRDVIRKRASNN